MMPPEITEWRKRERNRLLEIRREMPLTERAALIEPLLANLRLDELDKELEKRGPRFVRDAGDGNIYVRSARAGARVLASVTRDLKRQLKLVVNAAKSAVDRPWRRTFLGFRVTGRQPNRCQLT